MEDDERLREALIELETLRAREAERLRETRALLSALQALTASPDVDTGLGALLASIQTSLGCDDVLLFESEASGLLQKLPKIDDDAGLWVAPGLLTRPRRIVDLHGTRGLWETPPPHLAKWRALLSVPLADGEHQMVLCAFAKDAGRFKASDAELLGRLASVAGQAILRRGLERRNAFLASVIDGSPASFSISTADADLPLIYVNDAFERLTGYSRDEVLDQNCRLLSAEEPGSAVRSDIRKTISELGSGTFVLRNRRKDDTLFWNQLQIFPVIGADGDATHIVATQTDVTESVEAKAQRDEAQERMESALAATPEGFLVLGRQGHVRFANATFSKFFSQLDTTRDALLSPALAALLLDRPLSDMPDPIITAFADPASHEILAQDGRRLLLRTRPMQFGGAVVSVSDVTQIKVNERALRQRLAAIERSQDGIAIGDADGRIIDANPSLAALWGLEDGTAALGQKWTRFYSPATAERFFAEEGEFRRTGIYLGEAEILRQGDTRTHEISLNLVPEVGSILVVRDITDRLRDTEERDAMRRRLDRAQMQEHLHQVSAGLAHDFNNLLSAILGSAALLEVSGGLDDAAAGAVGRIQTAAGRAAELVDGLLDLGSRDKAAETIDLKQVVDSTVDLARAGAPSTVQITRRLPDEAVMTEASQTDLLQVVMNLVVNAIDALGGIPGEVSVSLRSKVHPEYDQDFAAGAPEHGQAYAAIAVEDTGSGMDADQVARILEPYFTTKGNTGTGLGLAIVASIIEDAGGLLHIDSEVGRGTKMTVFWPMGARPSEVSLGSHQHRTVRHDLPILVLDDVAEVAASHAAILSAAGFEVAEVDDPEAALEAIAEDPESWGCLITDYDMPGLTGGDVVERLQLVAPGLPVIVVSALARRLTDRRLANASNVLQKPVSGDTLVGAVRAATHDGVNADETATR